MKKIYLILSLSLISAFVFGQRIADKYSFERKEIGYKPQVAENHKVKPVQEFQRGTPIWEEHFAGAVDNGLTVTTGNGDWTKLGPNGDIWKFSNYHSSGCWSFNTDEPPVSSADNGYMLFDSDSANCQDPDAMPNPIFTQVPYNGELETPSIDLTGIPAVLLQFEHSWRWCCTDLSLEVAVSNDGGATYGDTTSIDIGPANAQQDQTTAINITPLAGGQDSVRIKFIYNLASHYYWVLDDIELLVPADNDLVGSNFAYSNWDIGVNADYSDLAYSIYQIDQVRPIDFIATANNIGGLTQTNVTLDVAIDTPGGVVNLSSTPVSIAPGEEVDLIIEDYEPPTTVGDYSITMSINQDATDATPDDNMGPAMAFAIDNDIMARDRRVSAGSWTNFDEDGYRIGNAFGITESATVYAIGVVLSTASAAGTVATAELWGDGATDFEFLETSSELTLENSMFNGTGSEDVTYFFLESPYDVEAGLDYYAHLNDFGGPDNAVARLSGISPPQTSFFYEGSEDTWYYVTSTPMVRLAFAEEVSIAEATIGDRVKLGQNVPNPFIDVTTIAYELIQAEKVNFEFFDITGKSVLKVEEGQKNAGLHSIEITSENFNSGIYYYSININGERITKRMNVLK